MKAQGVQTSYYAPQAGGLAVMRSGPAWKQTTERRSRHDGGGEA